MTGRQFCGLILLAVACGGGGTDPPGLHITLAGRIERSSQIALALVDGADTVPAGSVTWQVTPASAGALGTDSITGGTVLVPSVAGPLTVTAAAGGQQVSRTLQIDVPPRVVFALLDNGNRDIWVVALDGGDTARLTADPADDRQPTAAGGKVVFLSNRAAGGGLFSVTAAGEPALPLLISATMYGDPTFSSDGQRLAFTSAATGVPKVWVSNGDGTDARRLAPLFGFDGAIEGWPAWSPDDQHLALMSTDPGAASLFHLDSSGANPRPLIDTLTSFQPSWSPSGTEIVFSGSPDGGQAALFVLPASGGAAVRLTDGQNGGDSKPVWLPDGRIVYLAGVPGGAELRWLEPAVPDAWRTIPIPPGEPSSPAYYASP